MMHKVRVRYFASLREQAGTSEEWVETNASNARELYAELKCRYAFTLAEKHLKATINRQYQAFETPLYEGDEVVFIPPVSGG